MTGTLYVVATPIGNLGDISERARLILASADRIAAEDTRHTNRLLQHLGITTPTLSLHEHNEEVRAEELAGRLQAGENIALVSDAGTPLISDPGFRLVRHLQERDLPVVPVPGPCALIAALSVSGLPTDSFSFHGFLPTRAGARKSLLEGLVGRTETLVFYEACHRIDDSLSDMATVFGQQRQAVLARELTKTFETVLPGTLQALLERLTEDANQRKGEFVVLVSGAEKTVRDLPADAEKLMRSLLTELPLSSAARLAAEITGARKKALYELGLTLQS